MDKNNSKLHDLTSGNVFKTLIIFALPYLLSCFLQTFYGMADCFVVGLYNGPSSTTAVSIGSQFMHMVTVIIIGLSMGCTVSIGHFIGGKHKKDASKTMGNTFTFFIIFSFVITFILLFCTSLITKVMLTPEEAVNETRLYLIICFCGIPFITIYNVISSIFRGAGDSKTPMYFVAVSCVLNILLDFYFIGSLNMGACGAAFATVISQTVSTIIGLFVIRKRNGEFLISKKDFILDRNIVSGILRVGIPISLQDGFIQISFIVITAIANSRGIIFAASVGIVEKIISFFFLVPSALLSAISALTAQNMGADKKDRANASLKYALIISVSFGLIVFIYCNLNPYSLVRLFSNDMDVINAGAKYLMSYSLDCMIAAVHFCFSGYFCGMKKSSISFIHNIISILVIRIPGAYLASVLYPDTLYPMGVAAPLGSLLSAIICVLFFIHINKR